MKIFSKLTFACMLCGTLFVACHNKNDSHKFDTPFKRSLIKRAVSGTDFNIWLPAKYVIKKSDGSDFSVYYFYSADTTDKKSFRGGFYLGNAPGGSTQDSDSCKIEKLHSFILGDNKEWTMYNCNTKYYIQIITASKSKLEWGKFIDAFGRANSKAEINKLLEVYSTLENN